MTRFVWLRPVKNTKAVTTVKKFEEFVNTYGAPGRIISDRGTSFTAHKFEEFCIRHWIKHTLNSSRHPRANGLIERMNWTVVTSLKTSIIDGKDKSWDRNLQKIEFDINSTISTATGKAPFEALYGYLPRVNEGPIRELIKNCEIYTPPCKETYDLIKENVEKHQAKYKERFDENRYKNEI